MTTSAPALPLDVESSVRLALAEDVGSGDITAQLVAADHLVSAKIFCKEQAVLCGSAWVQAAFNMVAPDIALEWQVEDGAAITPGTLIATITGAARAILTAERTALNFLQTLSGTATISRYYANLVAHTSVKLLDTRKTLPGLRTAQKYAVRTGGCHNHRMGLYDAFLIKENHIAACGSIAAAVSQARALGYQKPVEIEVQNSAQLQAAIQAGADIVMLDNFQLDEIANAVTLNRGRTKLEASGGIDQSTLVKIAETGVDYISIGALTKHCKAIDFTLLLQVDI